jgi:hypothetical protein
MSSVISSYASIQGPPTKFFDVLTGGYSDNFIIDGDSYDMPIPFTVVNQVLDININQSSDIRAFVNVGDAPLTAISFQAKMMGGASLIKSFGPNMTTWLRNRIENVESLGDQYDGPLRLYVRPFMTKIQMASPRQGIAALNDESVYGVTTEPPTSTEYIGGGVNENFFTAWVFKTPMTVEYETTSGNKYITMTSQFSAN